MSNPSIPAAIKPNQSMLVILGNSRSGKDTIAKALGWRNQKFSQWAKDWVDLTFGGNFETDRHRIIASGKSKLDLLIELYHVLKPYHASVHYAATNWELPPSVPTCYTDVRTVAEMQLLAPYQPQILLLPGGEAKSSDKDLPLILEVARSYELEIVEWKWGHPATYSPSHLSQLLEVIA